MEKGYGFNAKQVKKINNVEADELFEENSIPSTKIKDNVSSTQVKQIVITNVLPPIEEQVEGVLYGIYVE